MVASPCRRTSVRTARVLMCSSSATNQQPQNASSVPLAFRSAYTRATSLLRRSRASVSRDQGLVKDDASSAATSSRLSSSCSRTMEYSGAASITLRRESTRARQFGVRPAHVDRHDRVRQHGAVALLERDLADQAGEQRRRDDANVAAELRPKHLVVMDGAVTNENRLPQVV